MDIGAALDRFGGPRGNGRERVTTFTGDKPQVVVRPCGKQSSRLLSKFQKVGEAFVKNYLALILFVSCLFSGCGSSSGPSAHMPGPATHFLVKAQGTATAGAAFNITINALDASNNLATSFVDTVHFTSSDSQAVLPPDQLLSGGTATVPVTLFTSGNQTITVTDTTASSVTGSSAPISVKVLTATHFSIQAPATTTTGAQFNITVTALDASNNQVPTYSGVVHYTSSDTQAVLPSDQPLSGGTGTFSVTLKTSGNQTIAGTDTATSSITGTSGAINVMGATHFSITAPSSATAGSAFSITVNAMDAANGVVPAYTGTVSFSSNDSQADLPPTQAMTSGTQTFDMAFRTAGSETITVTDTVTAIAGTSTVSVQAKGAENPVPLVNQPLEPGAVLPGVGDFTLTLNGSGFVAGSKVYWNGSARTTTFVSKSILKAAILAADVAAPNTAAVTVVSSGPGGGTSNVVFFETTVPSLGVAFGSSTLGAFQGPLGLAMADLNRDGKLDLVVANNGGGNISVLLGNGDGTFKAPVNYTVGSNPYAVAVADLNGDGKLDLAVANNFSANVSILLGNGDGTFQPAVNYSTPCCPSSVAVGDFNEDGKPDLVLATNAASVLLGNGDGTFQPVLNYPAGSNTATAAVGDFNGDGHLDLAVVDNASGNVNILLGNGDGTFQPALANSVTGSPVTMVAGDFNGDGILDLAVSNDSSNSVDVLIGNGNGTFQSPVSYAVTGTPWGLTIADLNGDGKPDLGVVSSSVTEVLVGNGDGTFQPASTESGVTPGFQNSLVAGDFNGQGRMDLVLPTLTGAVAELPQSTLAPSTNNLNFPVQIQQITSAAQQISLTNVTAQPISVSSIALSGTNASDFSESDTCTPSVAAGATCSISITFTPAQIGPRTASITITDDGIASPQSIALNGTGVVSGPNATLSATSISVSCHSLCRFGRCYCICSSTPVTVADYGSADLTISGVTPSTPFTETGNCAGTVTSGNSCSMSISLPRTSKGSFSGSLTITDNAPDSPQAVTLTGSNSCK